jgi:hypothetical protein
MSKEQPLFYDDNGKLLPDNFKGKVRAIPFDFNIGEKELKAPGKAIVSDGVLENSAKGLFSQVSILPSSDDLYNTRLNKKTAALFGDEEPQQDDSFIDDLNLAAPMVSYVEKPVKVTVTKKTIKLFE